MSSKEDPRDPALETKFAFPSNPNWYKEASDGMGTPGMLFSGLIMMTKNRFLAWPAVMFGVNSFINQHPLRAKEGGSGALSNMLLCLSALVASYMPLFLITRQKIAAEDPAS
ncbi:hypothetical protein CYLTODRAFT_418229 [Cylindrobasidium torrendii FP15055 ss-10]|uniref:Uncharacterized protein n=1 Tax=Cylindrobasidium torrendii FP15055 ss-10 TaxID=1314674 RepID=A0A0D7BR12_9AGAR|nr:hypothetical protein CYLTODRAFT_418229 [Cylindrobasidium torrendii FP15055 ss-10]